jgi:signal transduction histidine kinase
MIEKNNGKIEVKSEVGKGTEFRIYLPNEQKEKSTD